MVNDDENNIGSTTHLLINEGNIDNDKIEKIPLSKHKHIGQLVLLFTVFAFFNMGTYLYSVYLPNVFLQHTKETYPNYNSDEISSRASYYKSYSDSLPYVTLFLFGPLAGFLADKFGRKPILYFTIIITLLDVGSCFLSIKTNNLIYFYIAHTLAGINGVLLSIVFNCIADISIESHIAPLYSLLAFFMGFGVFAGPGLVLVVPSSSLNSTFLILYLTIGLTSLCLVTIPFIKETLTIAKESNKIIETHNSINPFKSLMKVFTASGYISWVILVYISLSFVSQDVWSTYYYYCSFMYGWDESQNAEFVVFLGFLVMVFGGLIFPFLLKYFSERKLISFSFLISVVSHVLLLFSGKKGGIWIFLVASGLGTNNPNTNNLLSSLISKASPGGAQGTILAGVTGITSIASFLGALASNDIYMFSISPKFYFPQFLYLLNTGILTITFIGTLLIWKFYKNPNPLLKSNI